MSPDFYNILVHIHSVGRWVVMLLLLIAIFNSLVAGQRPFIRTDARTGLFLTIAADLMLLIGLALWYFSPLAFQAIQTNGMGTVMKDPHLRFFSVEHSVGMLIAIILIHIGKAQGKKKISDRSKHNRTLLFYFLALVIILLTIPWPFLQSGAGRGWY